MLALKIKIIILTLSAFLLHLPFSRSNSSNEDNDNIKASGTGNPIQDYISQLEGNIVRVLQKCQFEEESVGSLTGDSNDSDPLQDDKLKAVVPWDIPEGLVTNPDNGSELKFSLVSIGQEWCESDWFFKIVPNSQLQQRQDPDLHQKEVNLTSDLDIRLVDKITLHQSGNLAWEDDKGVFHFSHPDYFCVFDSPGTKPGFGICRNCTKEIPCVPDSNSSEGQTSSSSISRLVNLKDLPEVEVTKVPMTFNGESVVLQKCQNSSLIDEETEENVNDQTRQLWNPPDVLTKGYDGTEVYMLLDHTSSSNWCKTNRTYKLVHRSNTTVSSQQYDLKKRSPDVRYVENITLSRNGSLTWIDIQGVHQFRDRTDFCVITSTETKEKLEFEICQSSCTRESPCVPKCCPESQIIDVENLKCIPTETYWDPNFYSDVKKKNNTARQYSLNIGLPYCIQTYLIQSNQDNKYPNLLLNGTLVLINTANHEKRTKIEPGQFCIDGFYASVSPTNGTVVTYSESEWDQVIIGCRPDGMEIPSWIPPLYATVNHTAALFLFLTALVYLLLWSHQNIHGWLQFSYAVSLFFAFSFLAIVQVWSHEIYNVSPDMCACLGWLIHLTFLSAFFWLTSMNFDLWWRFSGNRSLRRIRSKPYRENVKRFFLFASFSLGIPISISGTAVALDHVYRDNPADAWIKLPSFGAKKCYFEDKTSQFPFLYGPVGVLLLINLIFFTSTVMHLRKIHSNTELARAHSTLEDKKGVRLIAKLFIVMGVLWIFEFISWAANVAFPNSEVLLIWLFMPTDILNSLQGIAIFMIFICKPNVLSQLKAKYQWVTEEKTHTQNSNSIKT